MRRKLQYLCNFTESERSINTKFPYLGVSITWTTGRCLSSWTIMLSFPSQMVYQATSMRISEAPCIVPRLYLTDYDTATNVQYLSRLAATHVVSVLEGTVDLPPFIKEENRLHIRILDSPIADLFQHLDKTTAFIQAALEENEINVVVVGQPS